MPRALICSHADLTRHLARTVLWREDMERTSAGSADEAFTLAVDGHPHVILVDRDLPGSRALVGALRQDEATRRTSIAVLARGDFEPSEIELLEAGANAVLRLPPDFDWDDRLMRLLDVAARREARLAVSLRVAAPVLPGDVVNATALNISRSGLLIEARGHALDVGAEAELRIELPGTPPVPAQGRVVRQAAAGQFGMQFTRLDAEARQRIESFVQAAAAA